METNSEEDNLNKLSRTNIDIRSTHIQHKLNSPEIPLIFFHT